GEPEQVSLVGDHAVLQQRGRRLVPQNLDVQRVPPGEVEHPLPQLGRATAGVGAADVDVALLGRRQGRPALRAVGGHHEVAGVVRAQVHHRPEDLRDHVPGLAYHHRVTDLHALACHLSRVVQGGERDRGPGHVYRLQLGVGGDPAGTPDVDLDVAQDRVDLL